MNLTKEDLVAIENLIEEKLAPIRVLFKEAVQVQIETVHKFDHMHNDIKLIRTFVHMSPERLKLERTLKELD